MHGILTIFVGRRSCHEGNFKRYKPVCHLAQQCLTLSFYQPQKVVGLEQQQQENDMNIVRTHTDMVSTF